MSGETVRQTLASLIRQYHAEGSVSGATTHGGAHRRGAHPTCTNRWCVTATRALATPDLDPDRLAHALEHAIGNYRGIDDLAAKTVARYRAAIHQQDTDRAAR